MPLEVLTKSDLELFKNEFFDLLRTILTIEQPNSKPWLKSNEVRKILGCSHGTLQNLRNNGTIHPQKIGGTWYYSNDEVLNLLSRNNQ